MKKLFLFISVITLLASCGSPNNNSNGYNSGNGTVYVNPPAVQSVSVTPQTSTIGDNLDLQALGELVKTATNAQDLENKLNSGGTNSINNLDLDGDGKVDYIKVTEYGDANSKGFSFTVELPSGEKQEVATVEIQKGQSGNNQQATMNISGNQQLYGNNNYYSGGYSLSDMLIMSYLFSPHSYYMSPYGYGRYPGYYHPYSCLSSGYYHTRVSSVTKTTKITKTVNKSQTASKSPNKNLNSSSVNKRAADLSNSNKSQKSFQKTAAAKAQPKTNGFGNNSGSGSGKKTGSSGFGNSSGSSSGSSSSKKTGSSGFGSSSHSSGGGRSSGGGGRRSDVRFKQNIVPLANSLGKVCSLQGMTYDWRISEFPAENFDTTKQVGFIAQDIEKVYPMLVNTRSDGYKTVDYEMLVPALVEAIKELKAQVNAQSIEISKLKTPTVYTTSK